LDVYIIPDKSQKNARKSQIHLLIQNNIPVFIDFIPGIAHNKVMIIDGLLTLTGSFNFTNAGDSRNAKNVLIIEDRELANLYKSNWEKRRLLSTRYKEIP